jgi:TonB family protein
MQLLFAGVPPVREPEPWGRAYFYSVIGHGTLALLFFLLPKTQPQAPKTVLTEVKFVEAIPLPVISDQPAAGGAAGGRETGAGMTGRVEKVESHTNLANRVPLSSPAGEPGGEVVTNLPMAGPIVPLGELGMVGKRRGALVPLTGRTEGRKASGPMNLPTGVVGSDKGGHITLARADIGQIRKQEASVGVPLISQKVVGDTIGESVGSRMRHLATNAVGERRKPARESLKANPHDKDKWGKGKGPFSMEGPLKYRKILKLELPPYPRWAEEQGVEASVSFRLWVDPKGRVKDNMYLEKASGYSELDHLAKEALMKFVFVPLPGDQPQEDEWGVATFRFEFKK